MKKQGFFSLGLFLLVCLFWPTNVWANGDSIAVLIDQAEPGTTIRLEAKTYQENVVISKPVKLVGQSGTAIQGDGTSDVVTIKADGVTLEKLEIHSSGKILEKDHAAVKVLSNKNTLKHLTISESLHGIYLEESSYNELEGNVITGFTALERPRRGNGIHLFHASNNVIKNNEIYQTRDGVYFSFSQQNKIEDNNIYETRYGLHYMYSDQNEFYRNAFYNNMGGAALMYSNQIVLENNKFYDHQGLRSFGVLLQTSNEVTMKDNEISFNQKGIFMDQSNRNVIQDNLFFHNQIGLIIWTSSMNNIFTGNQIMENKVPYSTNGSQDRNQWSLGKKGNYWDDHIAFDLNNDGIADDPFRYSSSIGKELTSNQLGYLFLNSPALAIYENMQSLFQQDKTQVMDPYPMMLFQQRPNGWLWSLAILGMVMVVSLTYWKKRFRMKGSH